MSINLMTAAWQYPDLNPGQKLVLLALCDNASDEGLCFPSVTTVAGKCSMGLRTVQEHIKTFEAMGLVKRHERPGRSTIYMLDPRRIRTPAESAPPQNLHPTPAESAPITINEPSEKKKRSSARSASAKRCPQDFVITEELRQWAAEKADLVDIDAETENFRDYEFAKARSDWPAVWRTWMRRAHQVKHDQKQRDSRFSRGRTRPEKSPEELAEDRRRAVEYLGFNPFDNGPAGDGGVIEGEGRLL